MMVIRDGGGRRVPRPGRIPVTGAADVARGAHRTRVAWDGASGQRLTGPAKHQYLPFAFQDEVAVLVASVPPERGLAERAVRSIPGVGIHELGIQRVPDPGWLGP